LFLPEALYAGHNNSVKILLDLGARIDVTIFGKK
jgi:hypothetical protein